MAPPMSIPSYLKHWELVCLLRYDLCWIKRSSWSRSVFTDPATNQTSNLVMLLREEGCRVGCASVWVCVYVRRGSPSLLLPVSNRDLWISVCLLPWFLPLPVSRQSKLDAPRTRGGNGATLSIPHRWHADTVCLRCAVSIWPNLKQIGKMIVICRGAGAALFSTITFRKPFRGKKRGGKKSRSGLFKRQFSPSSFGGEALCDETSYFVVWNGGGDSKALLPLSLLPSL